MAKKDKKPVEEVESEEDEAFEVEKITKHKIGPHPDTGKDCLLYKVRWLGYEASDDTWEPEENIIEGAASILDAYRKKKTAEGDPIVGPEDKKKKPRASEPAKKPEPMADVKKKSRASEIKVPDSKESSSSSSRRKSKASKEDSPPVSIDSKADKKKSSKSRLEEITHDDKEVEVAPPSTKRVSKSTTNGDNLAESNSKKQKAAKADSPIDSDGSAPARKKQAKKESSKKRPAPEDEEMEDGEDAPLKVAPTPQKKSKTSRTSTSAEAPEIVVPSGAKPGSRIHKGQDSWEHLLTVEALEQTAGDGHKWLVNWENAGVEYISHEIARRKFPQRMIDFFSLHLKFREGEPEDEYEQGVHEPMDEE